MGLLFGIGSALFALVFLARLLPRAIGLTVWLGSAGFSAMVALGTLYLIQNGSP
jgi:hypothetical protein